MSMGKCYMCEIATGIFEDQSYNVSLADLDPVFPVHLYSIGLFL